jgi:enoyl reductase-like protein
MSLKQLFELGRAGSTVKVAKIKASRAVYQDADIQRVEMRFEVNVGAGKNESITLEMSLDQAGETIRQLTAAYEAARPPLRSNTRGC